jgi:glycosyltransferase involved in cell wall biosynthesis
MRKKIIYLINVDWFFVSHRLPIAIASIENGYDVYLLTKFTNKKELLKSYGIKVIDIPFQRSSLNILNEILILFKILYHYLKIRPDIVHHITMKPIVYGSLAAKIVNIEIIVNAYSGLGYLFTNNRKSVSQFFIGKFLSFINNFKNVKLIFQNKDDVFSLTRLGILNKSKEYFIIKGSGVDLELYKETSPPLNKKIVILFPTRMLWDKGVRELFEATEILKNNYSDKINFILAGMIDDQNKSSVPEDFILNWESGEYIKWVGYNENIIDLYISSDIVVLPSYREGLPKSLIEASAIGRAIITTDAIGCRDCVVEGYNGIKIPVGSGVKLAEAIIKLIKNRNLII